MRTMGAQTIGTTMKPPKIELLGFPGCPNTPTLRANLASALETMGDGWTFVEVNQEQLPELDLRRGYPTPTILVDGRDLYGMPMPTDTARGCRVYEGGVPEADELARRLRVADRIIANASSNLVQRYVVESRRPPAP